MVTKKKEEEREKVKVEKKRNVAFQPGKETRTREIKPGVFRTEATDSGAGVGDIEAASRRASGSSQLSQDFERLANEARARRGLQDINPGDLGNAIRQAKAGGVDISNVEGLDERRRQELLKQFPELLDEAEADKPEILERFEAAGGFKELDSKGQRLSEAFGGLTKEEATLQGLEEEGELTNLQKALRYATGIDTPENVTSFVNPIPFTFSGPTPTDAQVSSAALAKASHQSMIAKTLALIGKVPPIITAGVTLGGAFLINDFFQLDAQSMGDRILKRESAEELQGQINTIGQMSSSVSGMVESGGMGVMEGVKTLEYSKETLLALKYKAQQSAKLDDRIFIDDKYGDIIGDIDDQIQTINEEQSRILSTDPRFDPETVELIVGQLKQQHSENVEYLRSKGYLEKDIGLEFYGV